MKRMSEVFDLPVAVGGGMFDKDSIYGANGIVEWVATFETDEQAQHAAHAINHADALADALEALLECAAENNLEGLMTYDDAEEALAAYRGGV